MTKKRIVSLFLTVFMVFGWSISSFAASAKTDYVVDTQYFMYVPNKYLDLGQFQSCIGYSGSINTVHDSNVLHISPSARIYGSISKLVTYDTGYQVQDNTVAYFNDCIITRTAGSGTVQVVPFLWDTGSMYPATSYYLQFNAQPGDKFTLVDKFSGATAYFIVDQ